MEKRVHMGEEENVLNQFKDESETNKQTSKKSLKRTFGGAF